MLGSKLFRRGDGHIGPQPGQNARADAVHCLKLIHGGEGAVGLPVGKDPPGQRFANAGKRLQRGLIGGVQLQQRVGLLRKLRREGQKGRQGASAGRPGREMSAGEPEKAQRAQPRRQQKDAARQKQPPLHGNAPISERILKIFPGPRKKVAKARGIC